MEDPSTSMLYCIVLAMVVAAAVRMQEKAQGSIRTRSWVVADTVRDKRSEVR
jgi:hypothetical protein